MTSIRATVLLCLTLVMSGCDSFKDQAISDAEDAVRARLKDPSSATFENVSLVYGPAKGTTREMYACGYVNARNSFGGLAGRTRFVVQQYASTVNGRTYFSTFDAVIEGRLDDASAPDDPASFDRLYWRGCADGRPVGEDGN